jgi:hypothetical protein
MFNPPPGDLNDREPSIHLASPQIFLYRSYRIGNAPIFLRTQQESPMGLAPRRFRRPLPRRRRILCLYGIYWPWRFENAVCARLPTEKHRLGQGWLQAHLAPGGHGHVWRSDAPCLTSGSGYKNSQRWSRALRAHPSKPDGIYYRSRHDPESGEPSSAAPLEESSTRLPFSSGNRKAA